METKELSKSAKADLELVEAIRKGDEKAFEKIFNKYYDSLLFKFSGLANDEEDAKELVLDAFIKLNTNLEKFDSNTAAFSTWIFKLTRNIFIDNSRSLEKRERNKTDCLSKLISVSDSQDSDENRGSEYHFKSNDDNPEARMLTKELYKKMDEIIDSMENKELSLVIKMSYFDGMSYQDIANEMNKPLGTIKAYLFRAKEILKKEFTKEGIIYFPCTSELRK